VLLLSIDIYVVCSYVKGWSEMPKISLLVTTSAVMIIVLGLIGCNAVGEHESQQLLPKTTLAAVVVDESGSTNRFELPLPRPAKIGDLATAICLAGGGEVQIFFVRGSGTTIGPHLQLPAGTPRPEPAPSGGIPSPANADLVEQQEQKIAAYQTREKARINECSTRIDAFVKDLEMQFPDKRRASRSAVREALNFAVQFLNSPTASASVNPVHRILSVFSDCREDSPESPKFQLPNASNIRILWVNPDPGSLFPLPGANPEMFTSTDGALEFAARLVNPTQLAAGDSSGSAR